jgi:signal transduction histidine kinase
MKVNGCRRGGRIMKKANSFIVESAAVLTIVYVRFIEVWRQKEAIVQRNRMTRLLVRNAGHEVRTPLNSIINYIEAALEEELDEKARLHLSKSIEASKSLIFVVNDLLHLTEAEDGEHAATHEDNVDLRSTMNEVICAFRSESARKNLQVDVVDDAAIPQIVRSNPAGLRQVLSNLLANAIQYSNGGHIRIALQRLSTTEDNSSIRISFEDEGVGLSEQQLERIFQDFEQILEDDENVQPPSDKAGGDDPMEIGLGLATVARFVRINHGQITMSSEGKGLGTTVSITIPFRNATPTSPKLRRRSQIDLPTPPIESLVQAQHSTGTQLETPSTSEQPPNTATSVEFPIAPVSPASTPSPLLYTSPGSYSSISSDNHHYPFPTIAAQQVGPKFNVLIAEDNPLNSRLLEMRLRKRGHDVEVAMDGKACLDVFQNNPEKFDVILMDIQVRIILSPFRNLRWGILQSCSLCIGDRCPSWTACKQPSGSGSTNKAHWHPLHPFPNNGQDTAGSPLWPFRHLCQNIVFMNIWRLVWTAGFSSPLTLRGWRLSSLRFRTNVLEKAFCTGVAAAGRREAGFSCASMIHQSDGAAAGHRDCQ